MLAQWDPERDIHGRPLKSRTVQIGIRNEMLKKYNESIIKITDLSDKVCAIRNLIYKGSFEHDMLPTEKEYLPDFEMIRGLE